MKPDRQRQPAGAPVGSTRGRVRSPPVREAGRGSNFQLFSFQPFFRSPFPMSKNRARERLNNPIIPRFDGNANNDCTIFFHARAVFMPGRAFSGGFFPRGEHSAASRNQRNATTDFTDGTDQTRRKKLRQERHLSRNSFYMLFISSMLRKLQNTPNSSVVSRVSSMISPPSRGGGGFVETTTHKTSSSVRSDIFFSGSSTCSPGAEDAAPDGAWKYFLPGSTKMPPLTGLTRLKRSRFPIREIRGKKSSRKCAILPGCASPRPVATTARLKDGKAGVVRGIILN